MPTLNTIKLLNKRVTYIDITMLFMWDIIRLILNPDAEPTTDDMLEIYAHDKPWKRINPRKLGCDTYKELERMATALIKTGGRSVKQTT